MCDPLTTAIVTTLTAGYGGYEMNRARKSAERSASDALGQQQEQYDAQTSASDQRYADQQTRLDAQDELMAAERERNDQREAEATAERQRLRNEQLQRQSKIAEGRSAVSDVFGQTFTPGFYDQQQQAFLDFQNPQLEDQYKDAGSELLFALTRTGLGQSSAMNKRQAKLADTYSQAGQDIVDEGARRRAQTEAAVNQQKQVLMGQAEAAHDPSYMRGLAQSQSASLAAPQSLSNIGDVFATALSGITSAYDQERRKTAIADRMRRASEYGISGAGSSNVVS